MVLSEYRREGGVLSVDHTLNEVKNGLQWKWSIDQGLMIEEASYSKGMKHGVCRAWHNNGVLSMEEFWKHGVQQGPARAYHINGMALSEVWWLDGNKHGVNRYWNVNGDLYKESLYWKGTKKSASYPKDSSVIRHDEPLYGRGIALDEPSFRALVNAVPEEGLRVTLKDEQLPKQSHYEMALASIKVMRFRLCVRENASSDTTRNYLLGLDVTN